MKFSYLIFAITLLASCSSKQLQKESTDAGRSESMDSVRPIIAALNEQSKAGESLKAEGTITLTDNGSSQSGTFELKSKRIFDGEHIDSLSMVVSGPFGITAAKFLGCTGEYCFYNAIEGENYKGKPDPKALEKLTGMKGLTIEALNNVVYGFAPNHLEISKEDSAAYFKLSDEDHRLYIWRQNENFTEVITFRGKLPSAGSSKTPVKVVKYERWNKHISPGALVNFTPDLTIEYTGKYSSQYYYLPNYIKAISGRTSLEIEYQNATQNPNPLTVKIKMPE
jgi:hypothetical protein